MRTSGPSRTQSHRGNSLQLEQACRAIEADSWRAKLIEDYRRWAERWLYRITRQYPGEDFEPHVMSALYIAAATWDPGGRSNFMSWFRVKARGGTKSVLRARNNRARGYKIRGSSFAGVIACGHSRRDGAKHLNTIPQGVTDQPDMPEQPRMPPIRFMQLTPGMIDRQFLYHDG